MNSEMILSVDIGTSFVKAGLYSADGVCIDSAKRETPKRYTDGALVQRADDFVSLFVEVVYEITSNNDIEASRIRALTFTGQMAGVVGVDKDMNALTDWSGTVDSRQDLSVEDKSLSGRALQISGTNTPIFAKKVQWFDALLGDNAAKVHKYLGVSGYVMGKIMEKGADEAVLEATTMAFTGIADMENRRWSGELCDGFGISTDKLPRIVGSTDVVGTLSDTFAQACGLVKGLPVVAGAGDKISSCIGTGLIRPGMIADECSTVGSLTLCVDKFKPNIDEHALEVIPGVIPGTYYMMYYIAGSGVAVDWFIRSFAQEEQRIAQKHSLDVHTLLETQAEQIDPGSDGLMAVGLLGGRSLPFTPSIRGAWIGHSFSHTKAHFYRSLLESLAFENRRALDIMRNDFSNLTIDTIQVLGGGASSDLWNSIKADVSDAKYQTMDRSDSCLLGAAIIGGTAVGIHNSLQDGAKFAAKAVKEFAPNEARRRDYNEIYTLYTQVVSDNMNLFNKLQKRRKKNDA